MPTFTPPLRTDWTFAEGSNLTPGDRRFWAHFGMQPRGRSVLKIAGVWTTVDYPTNDQINATTTIVNPQGETVPGAFLGGHVHPVTATIATELTNAGYGAYLT